jgi:hypothetical protein
VKVFLLFSHEFEFDVAVGLANCYFAIRRACNLILSNSVAGLARLEMVVVDFKGVRAE